jgi:hypothetical protein
VYKYLHQLGFTVSRYAVAGGVDKVAALAEYFYLPGRGTRFFGGASLQQRIVLTSSSGIVTSFLLGKLR